MPTRPSSSREGSEGACVEYQTSIAAMEKKTTASASPAHTTPVPAPSGVADMIADIRTNNHARETTLQGVPRKEIVCA